MFNDIPKEQILNDFKNGNFKEILNNFCYINDNIIIVNYMYFKYLANQTTYNIFTNLILNCIDNILSSYDKFDCHISIKKLNVVEINKHLSYIRQFSNLLKERYQDKMRKCTIHNASNLFSQIYDMIVPFIDKDTQKKIELI
jgi:hypothetical protein